MGEDEYVALSDSLAKYMKRLESLGQSQKGKERVSVFQAGLLADLVKKSGVNAAVDKEYKKAVERMKAAENLFRRFRMASRLTFAITSWMAINGCPDSIIGVPEHVWLTIWASERLSRP